MKKKLFVIFGSAVSVVGLLFVFFTSSYQVDVSNPETIRHASPSMSVNVLKGDAIKNYASSEK